MRKPCAVCASRPPTIPRVAYHSRWGNDQGARAYGTQTRLRVLAPAGQSGFLLVNFHMRVPGRQEPSSGRRSACHRTLVVTGLILVAQNLTWSRVRPQPVPARCITPSAFLPLPSSRQPARTWRGWRSHRHYCMNRPPNRYLLAEQLQPQSHQAVTSMQQLPRTQARPEGSFAA